MNSKIKLYDGAKNLKFIIETAKKGKHDQKKEINEMAELDPQFEINPIIKEKNENIVKIVKIEKIENIEKIEKIDKNEKNEKNEKNDKIDINVNKTNKAKVEKIDGNNNEDKVEMNVLVIQSIKQIPIFSINQISLLKSDQNKIPNNNPIINSQGIDKVNSKIINKPGVQPIKVGKIKMEVPSNGKFKAQQNLNFKK